MSKKLSPFTLKAILVLLILSLFSIATFKASEIKPTSVVVDTSSTTDTSLTEITTADTSQDDNSEDIISKITTTKETTTPQTQPPQTTTTKPELQQGTVNKLAYYNLSYTQKQVYYEILDGIKNYKSTIDLTTKIKYDDFSTIYSIISDIEYSYIHLPKGYTYSYDKVTKNINSLEIEYLYSKEDGQSATNALQNRVNQIKSSALLLPDDFAKIKFIHDSIIQNCDYDLNAPNPYNAFGALVEGRAVCEGYAKAMALLCNEVGIECILVTGNAGGEGHMWNMVKCNGSWYHLDATWDDPTGFGKDYVQYDYFNLSDSQIKIDHNIDTSGYISFPSATATDSNYFVKTGGYANSYDEAVIVLRNKILEAGNANGQTVQIKLSNATVYNDTMQTAFSKNGEIFDILAETAPLSAYKFRTDTYSSIENKKQNIITVFLIYE